MAEKTEIQSFHDSEHNQTTEVGDFHPSQADDYTGHKLGFDPFAPADICSAELHQQCKLVRNLRELKGSKYQRACECCGLPLVRDM